MEFLYLLEKIRNPVFDFFFSAITLLGDETAFLLISILIFWCVNKRNGYYVLISGFFGTLINQAMKLLCKIPRPWIKDSGFTTVGNSQSGAGGFSFPSGHTQNSVSTFGAIFLFAKQKWLKIACIVIAILVPVSRMYLGVHTPWDVLAGAGCALVILILLEDVFVNDELFTKVMPFIVGALVLGSIGFFIYAELTALPPEAHNTYEGIMSAKRNSRTLLGCSLGVVLVYVLDRFVIKFETKAPWYAQVIKFLLGVGIIFLVKSFADIPLGAVMGDYERIVRYFILVAFAGAVWPLTFPYFAKMRIPALDRFGHTVAVKLHMASPEEPEKSGKKNGKKRRKK